MPSLHQRLLLLLCSLELFPVKAVIKWFVLTLSELAALLCLVFAPSALINKLESHPLCSSCKLSANNCVYQQWELNCASLWTVSIFFRVLRPELWPQVRSVFAFRYRYGSMSHLTDIRCWFTRTESYVRMFSSWHFME